jgi:hypothetical protein
MDAQPTVDEVMPGAATARALAGSMAAEVGSTAAAIAKWLGKFSNREKPTIQVVGWTAQASSGHQPAGSLSGNGDEYTNEVSASRTAEISCGRFRSRIQPESIQTQHH